MSKMKILSEIVPSITRITCMPLGCEVSRKFLSEALFPTTFQNFKTDSLSLRIFCLSNHKEYRTSFTSMGFANAIEEWMNNCGLTEKQKKRGPQLFKVFSFSQGEFEREILKEFGLTGIYFRGSKNKISQILAESQHQYENDHKERAKRLLDRLRPKIPTVDWDSCTTRIEYTEKCNPRRSFSHA